MESLKLLLGYIPWFFARYSGYIIPLMLIAFTIDGAVNRKKIKNLQQDLKIMDDMIQNRWTYRKEPAGPKYAPGGPMDRL